MTLAVSVLATGSELLDGRVLDTNTNFIAKELTNLGLKLKRVLCVDDDLDELVDGLSELAKVSDLIITSGGLGPTTDDLTRDALARFAGVGLEVHPDALAHLEGYFERRGRVLDEANRRQTYLPSGSEMIPNPNGSAPGFITRVGRTCVCSLSGVPREFKEMFHDTVLPLLSAMGAPELAVSRHLFRLFGVAEALVGSTVESLKLPPEITISYRSAFPEIHLLLKAAARSSEILKAAVSSVTNAFSLRGVVFSEADLSLDSTVHELLVTKRVTVATAESCTGGMIGELLTANSGSSEFFQGGVITYSNEAKERELGVPSSLLATLGAVSAEVVSAMAEGARKRFDTDFALAASGIAGPGGGSTEKPVGTVYLAVASRNGVTARLCFLPYDRKSIRVYSAHVALDMLRRELLGLACPEQYPILSVL